MLTELLDAVEFDPAETIAMACGPEVMMRFSYRELVRRGVAAAAHLHVDGAQHEVRDRDLWPLPVRPRLHLQGRSGFHRRSHRAAAAGSGSFEYMARPKRAKLAVWKFTSCDGCQLSLLDCEDEFLALAGNVQIARFVEATSAEIKGPTIYPWSKARSPRRKTPQRILQIRRQSKTLITIGACATAGGIQALRNFKNVPEFIAAVYARPEYISTLSTSTAIADHVPVDFELRGCPINKHQLLEVIGAFINGRKPARPPTAYASSASGAAPYA